MPTVLSVLGQELSAFGFEQITVATVAIGPTLATANPALGNYASRALITVETASLRFTYDGTMPTTTVGHLLNAGDTFELEGIANITALKMIRTGGTSAAVSVTYERFYRKTS